MAKKTTTKVDLPEGVLPEDTDEGFRKKYPDYEKQPKILWNEPHDGRIELIKTLLHGRRGRDDTEEWVIATRHIGSSRGRRNGHGDRTYAISMKGNVCRVGAGPHVLKRVEIRVHEKNVTRLKPIIDLYMQGATEAGQISDRISSRRAEGYVRRARGERSWMWSQ